MMTSMDIKLVLLGLHVFLLATFAFVQIHYLDGFKVNFLRSPTSVLNRTAPTSPVSGRTTGVRAVTTKVLETPLTGVKWSGVESFRSPFHKYYLVNCSAVFRGNTSEIRRIGDKLFHDYEKESVVPSDLEVINHGGVINVDSILHRDLGPSRHSVVGTRPKTYGERAFVVAAPTL